ncbi:hypothetical protein AOLI_G00084810 [Acnodon oligacanthus]
MSHTESLQRVSVCALCPALTHNARRPATSALLYGSILPQRSEQLQTSGQNAAYFWTSAAASAKLSPANQDMPLQRF